MILLIISACTVILCDNVDAQEKSLNSKTLESVATPAGISKGVAEIKMKGLPVYIFGDLSESDNIYIANYGDPHEIRHGDSNGTVSVINTTTNTVIKDIPVGRDPVYIYGDLSVSDAIYVANFRSGTISVIDTTTNRVVRDIPVKFEPSYIYGDLSESDAIYVAGGVGNITIINTSTYAVKTIPVGGIVNYIYGNLDLNRLYLATTDFSRDRDGISVLNSGSISVFDTGSNSVIKNISLEGSPDYIYGNLPPRDVVMGPLYHLFIYATQEFENTVSVINTVTNNVTNITVGHRPTHIYGDDKLFVANADSDSVSVISAANNSVIKNIRVGSNPEYIYGDQLEPDIIYVANRGSPGEHEAGTVSAINTNSYNVKKITVGEEPRHIYGDLSESDTIYVANYGSGGISLINSVTNKVVAGVTFDRNPAGSGRVVCDTESGTLEVPDKRFVYVSSGTKCTADPNKGFEFSNWVEILNDNSTRTITASSGSPWAPILDTLNLIPVDPEATLTVNRFGNFTAYFRALPSPLPAEYWASLFTVVATALVGSLLIPAAVGWFKSKKQTSRLNSYHQEMASVYEVGKLDEYDTTQLNALNRNISDSYAAGKINNEQYTNLKNEVSSAYEEIFKKRMINREASLQRIKEEISDAYSKGKLTKLHYELLNEKVSMMIKQDYR